MPEEELEQDACLCCGARKAEGYRIAGRFLCRACERLLLQARPGTPGYDRLVACCRSIWTVFSKS